MMEDSARVFFPLVFNLLIGCCCSFSFDFIKWSYALCVAAGLAEGSGIYFVRAGAEGGLRRDLVFIALGCDGCFMIQCEVIGS